MSLQGALGHGRDVPGLVENDARRRLALAERRVEVLETALRAREAELELAALPQTAAPEAPGEVERLRARRGSPNRSWRPAPPKSGGAPAR
ncbi:MAG: hypothetical protein R2736_02535 [Solirubrobacterales bacterium]